MTSAENSPAQNPRPEIVDALKRRPRTDFGQLHGPDIAEEIDKAPGSWTANDLSERVFTEEAVENLEQILGAGE